MIYLKTKKTKILVTIVVLFILFWGYSFLKIRISNTDLPKGKIVFKSNLWGNDDIYLMNINGTDLRKLTKYSIFGSTPDMKISNFRPSFSHDGNKIVFESDRDNNDPYRKIIFGYTGKPVGWEYVARPCEIYIMDINTVNQNRLTYSAVGRGPVFFSLNDQKILYRISPFDNDPFYDELRVIDSGGGNGIVLAKGWGIFRLAKFSPDNKKVFFVFNGDIHAADIYKNVLTRLTNFNIMNISRPDKAEGVLFVDNFALSPAGDKITFVIKEKNALHFTFYSMNMDGSNMQQINRLDNPDRRGYLGYISEMKYSPDGKIVAFIGRFTSKSRPFYLLDESGNLNLIRDLCGIDTGVENILGDLYIFTPDSRRIIFVAGFQYSIFNNQFVWIKSIIYRIASNLKYYIFKRLSGQYDNNYLCVLDIKTGKLSKITRLSVSSSIGRDFIHWEER